MKTISIENQKETLQIGDCVLLEMVDDAQEMLRAIVRTCNISPEHVQVYVEKILARGVFNHTQVGTPLMVEYRQLYFVVATTHRELFRLVRQEA